MNRLYDGNNLKVLRDSIADDRTREEPTKPMLAEAAAVGQFVADGYAAPVPKVQIVTVRRG
jgi:hypothetical protein